MPLSSSSCPASRWCSAKPASAAGARADVVSGALTDWAGGLVHEHEATTIAHTPTSSPTGPGTTTRTVNLHYARYASQVLVVKRTGLADRCSTRRPAARVRSVWKMVVRARRDVAPRRSARGA
jgi:hypothetical protein